jgi:hypothetical protein
MIEYLIAICLLLLTLGHGILIHGCMKWSVERRVSTGMIDDRLGTLATLIDEALDMFSDVTGDAPSASPISHAPFDIKQMLTAALISKIGIGEDNGPQEEWKISEKENDTTQEEAET